MKTYAKGVRPFTSLLLLSALLIFTIMACDDDADSRFHICTVTFDSQGGDYTPEPQETYNGGQIERPLSDLKKGVDSVLAGWYVDQARTIEFDFTTPVMEDMTLYAKWKFRTEWYVTFNSRGGSAVDAQSIEIGSGDKAVLQEVYPTKQDSSFGGWYADAKLTQRFDFTNTAINQDYTLYARWVRGGMMYVQGGTFTMGKNGTDPSDGSISPAPEHLVTLDDFAIGVYEVSNTEFVAFLNAKSVLSDGMWNGKNMFSASDQNGYAFADGRWAVKSGFENHPAVSVSWHGADAFCKWLGGRLPTEAEWEFAARGGSKSQSYTYIGGNNPDQIGWYYTNSPDPKGWVQARGALSPNELGLYDMAGNAFEFCSDWATDYPADGGHQTNPTGPEESPWFPNKIMRGAEVWSGPNNLMPFFRNFNDPSQSYPTIGLRVLIP